VSKLDSHQGLFIRDIFIPFNLLFDFLGSLGIFKNKANEYQADYYKG